MHGDEAGLHDWLGEAELKESALTKGKKKQGHKQVFLLLFQYVMLENVIALLVLRRHHP